MKKGFVILCLLPLLFACGDIENCDSDQNLTGMIVRFYNINIQASKVSKKVGFTIGSGNYVYGSEFYNEDSTAIFLPIDPNSSEVTYFFNSDTSNHELVLSYDKEFSILDPKCDPSLTFTNLDTVSQTFDSTVVINPITNILFNTNIEIYF